MGRFIENKVMEMYGIDYIYRENKVMGMYGTVYRE